MAATQINTAGKRLKMIKNIVFDFGNVIIKWDVISILKKYDINGEKIQTLKEIIFESEEWLQLDKGTLRAEQAEKIFQDRVPDNLKSQVSKIMNTWFEKIEFNDEICNLIKKWKQKGYKIYGLSNTNIQFYEYIKESDIGMYFDGFIISAVEKLMKPDKKIYARLFEKFSLNPHECFFIDDTEINIIAGKECGMNGFVFNNNRYQALEKELEIITASIPPECPHRAFPTPS